METFFRPVVEFILIKQEKYVLLLPENVPANLEL